MIVLKFGGTSVKDSEAFKRVFDIVFNTQNSSYISGNDATKLIVLSASSGITDGLIALVQHAVSKDTEKVNEIFKGIYSRQFEIINNLISQDNIHYIPCTSKVSKLLDELRSFTEGIQFFGEASPRTLDKAMSYGEIFSTTIFNFYLLSKGIQNFWLDARKVLRTDSSFNEAIVDFSISKENIEKIYQNDLISGEKIAVTQGFIGSDFEHHTTTLGRGGSDFSAAIFGQLFDAEEIQIWTDVDGILSADPRVVQSTISINEMAFDEVRALAYFGAKVLHPQTLIPAIEANIPVLVLNSMNKFHPGTRIIKEIKDTSAKFHSVLKINASQISFNLANVDRIIDKSVEILSIFSKNSVKIFSISILPDTMIIWFEKNANLSDFIDEFLENYEIDESKDLIGITGLNLNKFNIEDLNFIGNEFELVSTNESKNTILMAVKSENGNYILQKINNKIIET